MKKISIIIPLYNHAKYITEALYSVLQQSYPVYEIIVVDDGSSDRSPQIVSAIADVRPEIKFWRHNNRGAHNTINSGIHRADGDFIAILNSDDVYHPLRFEKIMAQMTIHPDVNLICTGLSFIDSDGRNIENSWHADAVNFYRHCGQLDAALINANLYMTTSNFFIRRELFSEIGFFANLRYAHDLDFLLRTLSSGKSILEINEPLIKYRLHDTNTINEGALKVKVEWAACVAMYLTNLWCKEKNVRQWSNYKVHLDVIKKHQLSEAVLLFMNYFENHSISSLEGSSFWNDTPFVEFVRELVQ